MKPQKNQHEEHMQAHHSQLLKTEREKIKSSLRKMTFKGTTIFTTYNFSSETTEVRRQWNVIFKVLG